MSDYFMYGGGGGGANRFSGGSNPFQNRTQYAFEQATSAQHRQFHEMKTEMPSDVLELFRANQIGFLKAPIKKKCRQLDPISTLGMDLNQMFAIPNLQLIEEEKKQTKAERNERLIQQKIDLHEKQVKLKSEQWNPFLKQKVTIDPQRTLFVARLSFKTTQKDLKYEFERYGVVKSVIIPVDEENKSRGYGFVEFEQKEDFICAYKHANYRRIQGRKIIVDYQRGRTSLQWRPRRLDGGLGGESRMIKEQYEKYTEQNKAKKNAHKQHSREKERERSRNKKDRRNRDDENRYNERQYREKDYSHRKKDRKSKDRKEKKEKKDKKDKKKQLIE